MRRPSRPYTRSPRVPALAAAVFMLGAVTPSARAEIVSKLPGPAGLPFSATFIDASTDGRFVLLRVGASGTVPAPTGPEASDFPVGSYVLRDRVADTTTRLTFRGPAGEPLFDASPTGISDDGDRVLFAAEGLREWAGLGAFGHPKAVLDRSENTS